MKCTQTRSQNALHHRKTPAYHDRVYLSRQYVVAKLYESDERGSRQRGPAVRSKLRAETRNPTFNSVRDLMVDFDECCECGDCVDIVVMDHEPVGFVQTGDPESPQKYASTRPPAFWLQWFRSTLTLHPSLQALKLSFWQL